MLVLDKEDMALAAHGRESRHLAYRSALREGARKRGAEERQGKPRIGFRRFSGAPPEGFRNPWAHIAMMGDLGREVDHRTD